MHHKSQRSRQSPEHRVIVIMQLCIVILIHAHRCAMVASAIASRAPIGRRGRGSCSTILHCKRISMHQHYTMMCLQGL